MSDQSIDSNLLAAFTTDKPFKVGFDGMEVEEGFAGESWETSKHPPCRSEDRRDSCRSTFSGENNSQPDCDSIQGWVGAEQGQRSPGSVGGSDGHSQSDSSVEEGSSLDRLETTSSFQDMVDHAFTGSVQDRNWDGSEGNKEEVGNRVACGTAEKGETASPTLDFAEMAWTEAKKNKISKQFKRYIHQIANQGVSEEWIRKVHGVTLRNLRRWKKSIEQKPGAGRKPINMEMEEKMREVGRVLIRKEGRMITRQELKIIAKEHNTANLGLSKGWLDKAWRRNSKFFQSALASSR